VTTNEVSARIALSAAEFSAPQRQFLRGCLALRLGGAQGQLKRVGECKEDRMNQVAGEVDAVECKWDPEAIDGSAFKLFCACYPRGRNYLVAPSGDPALDRRYGDLTAHVCTPTESLP